MKQALFAIAALFLCGLLCSSAQAQTTTFNGVVANLTNTGITTGNVTFTLRPGIDTTISGNARFTPTTVTCVIANPAIVNVSGTGTITVTVLQAQTWQIGDSIIFRGTADGVLNATSVAAPMIITGTGGGGTTFTFTLGGTHNLIAAGTVGGIYASGGTGPCVVTQNSALNPAYTSYSVAIQPAGTTTSSFNTYAIGAGPIDISTIVPTPAQQPSYSFVDLFSNGQTISGLKNFTNTANTYSGGTFTNPIINNATFNTSTATNWLLITPTIQQPIFTMQPITLQATFNYALSWANPAAARSIQIPDPGGTDIFAFLAATQTFTGKTYDSGATGNVFKSNGTAMTNVAGIPTGFTPLNLTAQSGNIGVTPLYFVPAAGAGFYRISCYLVVTQAATVSSTLPQCVANWTDNDTNVGVGTGFTVTSTTNTLGGTNSAIAGAAGVNSGTIIVDAKASTNLQYSTANYASNGATPMQYAIHIRVEYLGL